ncbi:T9SS type A sorting domain-containing protein [Fluviicola sp.]|uniref:T9SS type A sorting domain-containing protein n=1 Tax=Fluviicola sp. TaxID=1917219 RepID=UPI0031D2AF64
MKNIRLKQFLIAGLLFLSGHTFAQQLPGIDSLKLIPANPTSNDALKVVCHTIFPYGGCQLNSIHAEQQGNDIFLSLDYTIGMITYICDRKDTIPIDNPGAGDFRLLVSITTNGQATVHDTDTLEFHIDPFLGIQEFTSGGFDVYPNPFHHELTFKTTFPVGKMELHAMTGKLVYSGEQLPENPPIDLSYLEQGIYMVTLTDPDGNAFTRRIVKQ